MKKLEFLISRQAVFHCSPRGGGSANRDFDVVHSVGESLDAAGLPDWMPPSLTQAYVAYGAVRLFQPSIDTPDGFRLFTPEECDMELRRFLETIEDAADLLDDDEQNQSAEAERWSKALRPIGEVMCSGNLFALDTANKKENGECPVVFLDHEMYFGGWLAAEDTPVVAQDVAGLLIAVLTDPLEFLASHWTGDDPGQQWFPESVSFSEA